MTNVGGFGILWVNLRPVGIESWIYNSCWRLNGRRMKNNCPKWGKAKHVRRRISRTGLRAVQSAAQSGDRCLWRFALSSSLRAAVHAGHVAHRASLLT